MSELILTPIQVETIQKLVEWYYLHSYNKQMFIIGGVAGSSKSTIVKYAIKYLELNNNDVLFATYIAKAALRLRMLGNTANTIHSTFYQIYQNDSGEVLFYRKPKLSSSIQLIVIDEAAMVPDKMINDILTFKIPTILLGDNCQLPPLMAKNTYMLPENLDVFLDKAMRFDDASGILELAKLSREKKPISYGKYNRSSVVKYNQIVDKVHTFDVVVCYKNATRMELNRLIRQKLNFTSIFPKKGEKIVCLKNNYHYSIMYKGIQVFLINGLTGIVLEDVNINPDNGYLSVKFLPDFIYEEDPNAEYFEVHAHPQYFQIFYDDTIDLPPLFEGIVEKNDKKQDSKIKSELIAFLTYGYALTCHKMQGSEANDVLVISDDFSPTHPDYSKYLYTAITRAKNSVTVATLK